MKPLQRTSRSLQWKSNMTTRAKEIVQFLVTPVFFNFSTCTIHSDIKNVDLPILSLQSAE